MSITVSITSINKQSHIVCCESVVQQHDPLQEEVETCPFSYAVSLADITALPGSLFQSFTILWIWALLWLCVKDFKELVRSYIKPIDCNLLIL